MVIYTHNIILAIDVYKLICNILRSIRRSIIYNYNFPIQFTEIEIELLLNKSTKRSDQYKRTFL